jgi:hypothetical protein
MRNLHSIRNIDIPLDLQYLAREWYKQNSLNGMPLALINNVLHYHYAGAWRIFPSAHQSSWTKDGKTSETWGNLPPFTNDMIQIL